MAKARTAIERLPVSKSFRLFEESWADFLGEYGRFWAKLEKGSKVTPQSRQWYGNLKRWCKNDQLVQYLFQARNEAEHGILDVTAVTSDAIDVQLAEPQTDFTASFQMMVDSSGRVHLRNPQVSGKVKRLTLHNPRVELVDVTDDRFPGGKVYKPPKMHNGLPVVDTSPYAVGRMAVVFMEKTLADG